MVAPFIGQKTGEHQKEKVFAAKRVSFQSESMWWPKKKVFAYQSVGFRSQKKKKQMVSPQNGDTRGGPPPFRNATGYVGGG